MCCTEGVPRGRPASPVKIVVAPNAFKGSLTASQAASAIARGVKEAMPDAEVVEVPVADGGDGTVEALVSANRGGVPPVAGQGPCGGPGTGPGRLCASQPA